MQVRHADSCRYSLDWQSRGGEQAICFLGSKLSIKLNRAQFGNDMPFYLFLCGYFDGGYLGYAVTEDIDWIWEHRISDLDQTGI